MAGRSTRRKMLRNLALTGAALSDAGLEALAALSPATAAEGQVTPDLVRFHPDIEPVVRRIEETPRERCAEVMVGELRDGLPVRVFLAGLYLAALRGATYHGGIHGFDHNAYSIHSVDHLSRDLPATERLLPLFWALDSFKGSQGRYAGPRPVALTGALPAGSAAEQELMEGLEGWDSERAERAVAGLIRSGGRERVGELLWPYAARDWYFIGHLAILVANSWRLLDTIGWRHAEPVLRYVVSGLSGMKREESYLGLYPENLQRVRQTEAQLPGGWAGRGGNAGLTRELLALLREANAEAACELATAQLLTGKAKAGAVWDAVHLASGEMVMSVQKGSEPLHANTAANALHSIFTACRNPSHRLLILLQALGWTTHFRRAIGKKGWLKDPVEITGLEERELPNRATDAVGAILAHASFGPGGRPVANPAPGWYGMEYNREPWRAEVAGQTFAFARRFPESEDLLLAGARHLLARKADGDPHRMKFPVAAFENQRWVSPEWRPHLLAVASYSFLGADALDTESYTRTDLALRKG